jgi:hypothetical protein
MLVVEVQVESPILREALTRPPDVTLQYEEQYQTDDGINLLFWASSRDFATFEDGLDVDPTVTNVTRLAETESQRLYRVTFTEVGEAAATFPSWSELDISVLDAAATDEGWELRMQLPDRESLRGYRDVCEERGHQFHLQSVYERRDSPDTAETPLTAAQAEALAIARDLGYFDIPRETSMADVAAELGISSQAASERIRRGITALVDASLSTRDN